MINQNFLDLLKARFLTVYNLEVEVLHTLRRTPAGEHAMFVIRYDDKSVGIDSDLWLDCIEEAINGEENIIATNLFVDEIYKLLPIGEK